MQLNSNIIDMETNLFSLDELAEMITSNIKCTVKEVLTVPEMARYLGVTHSQIYHMTMNREIPHYKAGKRVFFNRREVEDWLQRNRVATKDEISSKALTKDFV